MVSRQVCFGEFRFDFATLELWRDGTAVPLAPKPARVLAELLARPGTLVSRDELYVAGWGETRVSVELALNAAIRQVRRALDEHADDHKYIQTLAGRGYRFVSPVGLAPRERAVGRAGRAQWNRVPITAMAGSILVMLSATVWTATQAARPTTPTVSVEPIRLLDGSVDQATGDVLEESIRNAIALAGRHELAVVASPAYAPTGEREDIVAKFVVGGTLRTTNSGEPLLEVQVVRATDQIIVWTGSFNPFCPFREDPTDFIAKYMARVMVDRVAASAPARGAGPVGFDPPRPS